MHYVGFMSVNFRPKIIRPNTGVEDRLNGFLIAMVKSIVSTLKMKASMKIFVTLLRIPMCVLTRVNLSPKKRGVMASLIVSLTGLMMSMVVATPTEWIVTHTTILTILGGKLPDMSATTVDHGTSDVKMTLILQRSCAKTG